MKYVWISWLLMKPTTFKVLGLILSGVNFSKLVWLVKKNSLLHMIVKILIGFEVLL